jgi:Na+/proline symporter
MGGLFGQKVRVITAISGFIGTAGLIAVQLKLSGLIFGYSLGISNIYGITLAAVVVTLYSSLGGIKSLLLLMYCSFLPLPS